jgi:AIR carboxylase
MPKGIPVATVAIGNAANAGLLAARMLASTDSDLWDKYDIAFCFYYFHVFIKKILNLFHDHYADISSKLLLFPGV